MMAFAEYISMFFDFFGDMVILAALIAILVIIFKSLNVTH